MTRLLALCLLALAAPAVADAQPANQPDQVLRTETLTGTLRNWEFGDYLWARVALAGSPERVGLWIGEDPIGPFLEAHRGRPLTLTVRMASVYIPEAGGRDIIRRITAARLGRLTAQRWWQGLSRAQRRAARARFETAIHQ